MTISLGNAFKAIREDENWVKKIVIGGLISIIVGITCAVWESESVQLSSRIINFVLYLISGAFVSGFIVSTGNKMLNTGSNLMTEWSEKSLFLNGLKFLLSWIVYCIVLTLFLAIISVVLFIAGGIVFGIMYYLLSKALYIDMRIVVFLILSALTIILSLYFMQYINAAYVCYYKNLKFRDIMAFKKQFMMIKENQHAAWTLVGKEILYVLLVCLITLVLCVTVVGILLLPFVYFAIHIAMANLYVQYAKEIEIGRYVE